MGSSLWVARLLQSVVHTLPTTTPQLRERRRRKLVSSIFVINGINSEIIAKVIHKRTYKMLSFVDVFMDMLLIYN